MTKGYQLVHSLSLRLLNPLFSNSVLLEHGGHYYCQALAPNPYSPNPLDPTPTQSIHATLKTQISPKGTATNTKIKGAFQGPGLKSNVKIQAKPSHVFYEHDSGLVPIDFKSG